MGETHGSGSTNMPRPKRYCHLCGGFHDNMTSGCPGPKAATEAQARAERDEAEQEAKRVARTRDIYQRQRDEEAERNADLDAQAQAAGFDSAELAIQALAEGVDETLRKERNDAWDVRDHWYKRAQELERLSLSRLQEINRLKVKVAGNYDAARTLEKACEEYATQLAMLTEERDRLRKRVREEEESRAHWREVAGCSQAEARALAEDRDAVSRMALGWLCRIYSAVTRDGWEQSETEGEAIDALNCLLDNADTPIEKRHEVAEAFISEGSGIYASDWLASRAFRRRAREAGQEGEQPEDAPMWAQGGRRVTSAAVSDEPCVRVWKKGPGQTPLFAFLPLSEAGPLIRAEDYNENAQAVREALGGTADAPEFVSQDERGFKACDPVGSVESGEVRVYESSAAEEPCLWVRIRAPRDRNRPAFGYIEAAAHLSLADAEALRARLDYIIGHHYQNLVTAPRTRGDNSGSTPEEA